MSTVTIRPEASATVRHALNLALSWGRHYTDAERVHLNGLGDDLLLAELGQAPVTTPEPVTIAYIAIGAAHALRDGDSRLVDRLVQAHEGQLNVIEAICAHALMLDQLEAAETGGLNGVFAYEIAEEFGYEFTRYLVLDASPNAADIAAKLFAQMQGRPATPSDDDLPF